MFLLGVPGDSDGKERACNMGDLGLIPGLRRPPGEGHGKSLHILAWRIPIDREGLHGGLQSMGLQRVRHDWVTKHMFLQRYSSSFGSGKLRVCMCLSLQLLVWQLVLLSWLSAGFKQRRRLSLVQVLNHLQFFVTP